MNLLEVYAKKVLADHGIPVPPRSGAVESLKELPSALKKAGKAPWAIKAQVQTGGRGKAGGIKTAANPAQAKKIVSEILGMKLVTAQTGPEGIKVKKIMVEKSMKFSRELYFSITLDRKNGCPVIIASAQGGMDIETLAKESPDKIGRISISAINGLEPFQGRELLFKLGLYSTDFKQVRSRIQFFQKCVKAFLSIDASLLEINPLAVTPAGELICLDAKITLDDSASYRHPEFKEFEDPADSNPAERRAKKADIAYIQLKGTIGCMVNGAGLAMATMDIIKQHGGEPANFLDVGGGANVEQVTTAFEILLSDKKVNAIFVNIFGGIMRCDVIAEGIVTAVKKIKLSVPLVVRLEGNKLEEGRKILSSSNLNIISINELSQAAKKIVEVSRQ